MLKEFGFISPFSKEVLRSCTGLTDSEISNNPIAKVESRHVRESLNNHELITFALSSKMHKDGSNYKILTLYRDAPAEVLITLSFYRVLT